MNFFKKQDIVLENLSTTHLSHYYSHVYNNCLIIPKLKYSLVAASLTNKHFNKMYDVLYPAVVASKSFNRHWPTQLRYDLHKYSGIGLWDIEIEQGIRKNQINYKFLYHPKHQTLIHAIVDWYLMSIELRQPMLQNPHQMHDYVSSVWLNNLIHFMVKKKSKNRIS